MIQYAYAQGQAGAGGGTSSWINIVFIVAMIGIFYFLLIRPQQKREKDRKGMISTLKKGDKVLTAGGLYGVIDSFKDNDIVILKIANNTKVEFTKSAIQSKLS